jgi:hypothetical protein
MTEWPSALPALPAALPHDRPVALLLRHGERPAIPAGETGADLPLTPRGRAQAEALGRALRSDLRGLHTSPVRRCSETAEAIRTGAGAPIPIVPDRTLGDPGIFVSDPERAWVHWRALGHEQVLEHLAWHLSVLPGLADPILAARALAAHLLAILDARVAARNSGAGGIAGRLAHGGASADRIRAASATSADRVPLRLAWYGVSP